MVRNTKNQIKKVEHIFEKIFWVYISSCDNLHLESACVHIKVSLLSLRKAEDFRAPFMKNYTDISGS